MTINRRFFLGGLTASAGLAAFGVPAPSSDARLRIGILSDIHIRGPETAGTFKKALAWFRDRGVDGVIIAGDMADTGQVAELQVVADAWYGVFPNDKAPDGRHVEKLFVYGNHDFEGYRYFKGASQETALAKDLAGNWEKCFHEPYAPVYSKTVKGYTFIGMHWGNQELLGGFISGLAPKLDPSKPFFYAQHAHPYNTCYGPWAWGAWDDHKAAAQALAPFPNAIAFSGHSHHSLTDERSIWQDAFTSVGTASLSYIGTVWGRENGDNNNPAVHCHMPRLNTSDGRQGMLLTAYPDRVVLQKRDFVHDCALGPDWVLPPTCRAGKPYAFAPRAAASRAPEFAAGAKLTFEQGKGKDDRHHEEEQLTVSFPAAAGHVLDYAVQAQLVVCDVVKPFCTKRVFAEKFYLADDRQAKTGRCAFALAELPKGQAIRFAVRPANCWGKQGAPLYSELRTLK